MASGTRRFPRWFAFWLLLALGVATFGVAWAREPDQRREIFFEAPFRIVSGASMTGRFTPDHDGLYSLEFRFREGWLEPLSEKTRGGRAGLEALGKDIGGGWHGESGLPRGFKASYTVRVDGTSVASGVTGDHLGGFYGWRGAGVSLTGFTNTGRSPHEFEVHVDNAVDAMGKWDPRLVVAASGDWWHYRWLEVLTREVIVAGVGGALVLFGLIAFFKGRARARRAEAHQT